MAVQTPSRIGFAFDFPFFYKVAIALIPICDTLPKTGLARARLGGLLLLRRLRQLNGSIGPLPHHTHP